MHPNAFLKSYWRPEENNQVFVAMSFDERYLKRFNEVIKPAIEEEEISGTKLTAHRVDNSKSGDSILTDIVDGIAHSRIILADVSVIDQGINTHNQFRNGNVMYELGIALACRTPSEILIIRDDSEKILFDLSTIPHMRIDFSDGFNAILNLRVAIKDRIDETNLLKDARIQLAASTITSDEIRVLKFLAQLDTNQSSDLTMPNLGMLSNPDQRGLDGLLRKGCVKSDAMSETSKSVFYSLTKFGFALEEYIDKSIIKVTTKEAPTK